MGGTAAAGEAGAEARNLSAASPRPRAPDRCQTAAAAESCRAAIAMGHTLSLAWRCGEAR